MLNPLLYGFMSDWMRNHLKNMWHNYRCWNPHSAFRNRLNSKFFTSNTTVCCENNQKVNRYLDETVGR